MSDFIISFDTDLKGDVMAALKAVQGVVVSGRAQANGTVRVKTVTRHLDDETAAIHAMEDIHGVLDVRLIEK